MIRPGRSESNRGVVERDPSLAPENCLGFRTGISGQEHGGRAGDQAEGRGPRVRGSERAWYASPF